PEGRPGFSRQNRDSLRWLRPFPGDQGRYDRKSIQYQTDRCLSYKDAGRMSIRISFPACRTQREGYAHFFLTLVLQGVMSMLPCTDLDHILHIVYKYFSVSHIAGIKDILHRLDQCFCRDLGDHHIDLYLGKKPCLNRRASEIVHM